MATHCNTLQHTSWLLGVCGMCRIKIYWLQRLHHTATHCNTLQHTATHCDTPAGYWVSVGCVGSRYTDCSTCATPHHTATHCNTQLAIGCLWDVSDRDIDRFADALFRFGGLYLNQVSLTWHYSSIRDVTRQYLNWLFWLICTWIPDPFVCGITHVHRVSLTWHASWLICACVTWHDSCVCDMTLPWTAFAASIWIGVLKRDITRSCVTRLVHVWHDSFVRGMIRSYLTCLNCICIYIYIHILCICISILYGHNRIFIDIYIYIYILFMSIHLYFMATIVFVFTIISIFCVCL